MNWLQRLGRRARRGSKPRCHRLMHGGREEVASRLSKLAEPWGVVSVDDFWMPDGFYQIEEACLDKSVGLLKQHERRALRDWWLAVSRRATTPNLDIASTCSVEGKAGLLLVEAKAHSEELNKQTAGKELSPSPSLNSQQNHFRIGECILEANSALTRHTGLSWTLSRDHCYQMSNRFAWSWKLTELGFSVVLVYLGFLNAEEMRDQGEPFANHVEWESLVKAHSQSMFPGIVWGKRWEVNGQSLFPCIRTLETAYDVPIEEDQ